jgi:periplasmic divalent cation tolerance protein
MADEFLQVVTTIDSEEEARRLARVIVDARVAACAQVLSPISSTYWWQGKVEVADEWMIVIKTAADRLDDLVTTIKSNHSYDTPEIVATPISGGNSDYLNWIQEETRTRS